MFADISQSNNNEITKTKAIIIKQNNVNKAEKIINLKTERDYANRRKF